MALTQIDHDQYGGHVRVSFTSLSNASGATRSAGEVVVQDTGSATSFTTTTTQGDSRPVFVVVDTSIASSAAGYVAGYGIVTINVQGNVSLGSYLRTSTTVGRAEDAGSSAVSGVFGRALTAFTGSAGTVTALLFGITLPQTTSTMPTGSFSDVSGSRALGTVYQNTGTTAREVTITLTTSDGMDQSGLYLGGSTPTFIQSQGPTGAIGSAIRYVWHFWVLPNEYYKVTQESGSLSVTYWKERN